MQRKGSFFLLLSDLAWSAERLYPCSCSSSPCPAAPRDAGWPGGAVVPCRRAEDLSMLCRCIFFFQVPRCVHHNTSSHQIAEKDTRKSFGRRSRGTQHLLQALIQLPLAPAAFPGQNSPCAWPGGEKKSERTAPGPLAAGPIKMAPCPSLR